MYQICIFKYCTVAITGKKSFSFPVLEAELEAVQVLSKCSVPEIHLHPLGQNFDASALFVRTSTYK